MASSENKNLHMERNLLGLKGLKSNVRNMTIPTIEQSFYQYGITVARRPMVFIILSLLITAVASIGLCNFTIDKQSVRSWFSQDSVEHVQNFPINLRQHTVIYEADNVLLKEVLLEMLHIHTIISTLATKDTNLESLCFRVPQINSKDDNADRKSLCNPKLSKGPCLEKSILQIWGYNKSLIESLSQQKILWDINYKNIDSLSGFPVNTLELLGRVNVDEAGDVISAKTSMHTWVTAVDEEAVSKGDYNIDIKTGFKIDYKTLGWENEFMNSIKNYKSNSNITMYFEIASDIGLVIDSVISSDLLYLVYGIILMFFYATIKVGRFNLIHQKPWTSICGLTCVIKAITFSYGICSAIGIPYGPANHIIPIILLGLCVNNMFIITQTWSNLSNQEMKLILSKRVGCMVRDTWLPITITFVVTLVVFCIGSLSVLPAIRYFCIYAAISVGALYFFQATAFIAWFTIDQKRLEDSRNGLLFCLKHNNWKPSEWSQKEYFQTLLYHLCSRFFHKQYFKIIVLITTTLMATGSSIGVYNIQNDIQIDWLLPQNSHVQQFLKKIGSYYPFMGEDGYIVFNYENLEDNINKVESLINSLKKNEYIGEVQNFVDDFEKYLIYKGMDTFKLSHNDLFKYSISHYSQKDKYVDKVPHIKEWKRSVGRKEKVNENSFNSNDLRTLNSRDCRSPNSTSLSISFKYRFLNNSEEKISAMNEVLSLIKNIDSTDGASVHMLSTTNNNFKMKQIIGGELYQILGLTLLATLVATLLLASLRTALLITLCVMFTLVDVGFIIVLCGLTVNVITALSLLVGVGLCIDYSVHIARTFMVHRGTQDERAHRTITSIGPAVIKGGLGSIISILLLVFADSYFFSTFFKVLLATILLGLFHALVFLPVALSLIGPEPNKQKERGGHLANNISTFTMENPKYLKTHPDEDGCISPANVSFQDIPIIYNSSPEVGSREEQQALHNDIISSRGLLSTASTLNANTT